MYTRSSAFDEAIKESHVMVTRCEVWLNGKKERELHLKDGNVVAADEAIRRRCNITLTDPDGDLVPEVAGDLLSPFGSELKLFRGLRYNSGQTEVLPLGVFGISDVKIDDSGDGLQMLVEGYDRARKVARARLNQEYTILSGTNYGSAIQNLIIDRYPSATFNPTDFSTIVSDTTPQLVFDVGEDGWGEARKLARNVGYEVFLDVNGDFTFQPIQDPTTVEPVWDYSEGEASMLSYINKRMVDEDTYNHVVVTGETPENAVPVRAEAKDDNPSSPTYYLGPYGDVTYFYSSTFIKTQNQAQAVADGLLNKALGETERVTFLTLVHPAHEVGDVVTITRAKSKLSNDRFVFSKLTIPMTNDRGMNATTKKRKS